MDPREASGGGFNPSKLGGLRVVDIPGAMAGIGTSDRFHCESAQGPAMGPHSKTTYRYVKSANRSDQLHVHVAIPQKRYREVIVLDK